MKLLTASILAASIVSYTYADICLSPLIDDTKGGVCVAYKGKKFISVNCDDKDGEKLKIGEDGKLCAGPRCLIRKKNKRDKIKIKIAKKAGKNGETVYFDYTDGKLTVTSPNAIKDQYPVFRNEKISFDGKPGDIRCSVKKPTTAVPTTPVPTTSADVCKYEKVIDGCWYESDRFPDVKHPNEVYRKSASGIFIGKMPVVKKLSVEECQALCDDNNWCIGVEYISHEDKILEENDINYKNGDCQLNFKDKSFTYNCAGWGTTSYKKMECNVTTMAPTTVVKGINIVGVLSRVNIEQTSDNQLRFTKPSNNGYTSLFIEYECNHYTIEIVKYNRYNMFGWSIKDDAEFKKSDVINNIGIKPFSIGSHNHLADDVKAVVYNYLNGKNIKTTHVDRQNKIGETIKVSKTDTFVEFSRNGVSYFKYSFLADDMKDLFPAVDMALAGDEYIITMF